MVCVFCCVCLCVCVRDVRMCLRVLFVMYDVMLYACVCIVGVFVCVVAVFWFCCMCSCVVFVACCLSVCVGCDLLCAVVGYVFFVCLTFSLKRVCCGLMCVCVV